MRDNGIADFIGCATNAFIRCTIDEVEIDCIHFDNKLMRQLTRGHGIADFMGCATNFICCTID